MGCSIKLQSSHTNGNSLILYPSGGTPALSEARFYGGPSWSLTDLGLLNSYLASGPVCFEAPGNGDWTLGYNNSSTDMKTRQSYGGADVIRDFPAFDGGDSGHAVFILYNMMGGTDATKHYSTDYSILKFDVL